MLWASLIGCSFEVFTFTLVDASDSTVVGEIEPAVDEVLSLDELVSLDGVGQDALDEAGVAEGDLSQLRLLGLSFALVDPTEDNDLDFLESVEVWLSADGLDDVLIASKDPLPGDVTEVSLDVTDLDLAPYIVAEGLAVSTFATGRLPLEDTVVRTTVEVEIGVTAQGAWSQLTGR